MDCHGGLRPSALPNVLARPLQALFGLCKQSSRPFKLGRKTVHALARFFRGSGRLLETLLGFTLKTLLSLTLSLRCFVGLGNRVPRRLHASNFRHEAGK